jgi:hypothetical protein
MFSGFSAKLSEWMDVDKTETERLLRLDPRNPTRRDFEISYHKNLGRFLPTASVQGHQRSSCAPQMGVKSEVEMDEASLALLRNICADGIGRLAAQFDIDLRGYGYLMP